MKKKQSRRAPKLKIGNWYSKSNHMKPRPAKFSPSLPPILQVSAPDQAALGRLAENVWRLGRRAAREESGWAAPMIERLHDDLRDLEIEIIDRTGTPYRDGETLELVHSDAPTDWTGALIVTEVIAPTIRVTGVIVEHGKVVVGAATTDQTD